MFNVTFVSGLLVFRKGGGGGRGGFNKISCPGKKSLEETDYSLLYANLFPGGSCHGMSRPGDHLTVIYVRWTVVFQCQTDWISQHFSVCVVISALKLLMPITYL